jgi:hypothetical protein
VIFLFVEESQSFVVQSGNNSGIILGSYVLGGKMRLFGFGWPVGLARLFGLVWFVVSEIGMVIINY